MFVFREEYYLKRMEPREGTEEHARWIAECDAVRGVAEVIIGKQRHGPIGKVELQFEETLTKFANLDRGMYDDYRRV
jgi:replicative DNA helicase